MALAVLKMQMGKHPERVFTYQGKPFNAANTHAWKKALVRAGIEDFRWHACVMLGQHGKEKQERLRMNCNV